jgi:hypothetical protein
MRNNERLSINLDSLLYNRESHSPYYLEQ